MRRGNALCNTIFFVLLTVSVTAALFSSISLAGAALLNPASTGFGGQTRSANYDALLDAMYASGNTTTTIGDRLWVPWFGTSSGCALADLKAGSSCNSGQAIDFTHNCMVTDEFSQVGILVAMGDDQTRMDEFYNTVQAINSSFGRIPAWRVYRDGNTIQPCRSGINGNCDTASDATARIINALYTASDNSRFADEAQKGRYGELARNLSMAFVRYEVVYSCKQSSLGHGDICWWLAAGSQSKIGGMGGTDFGYTGYYPDAIIAMLQACTQTGNMTYCQVAGNFTLNYLQASKWDGANFRVPPGRSFRWGNLTGIPVAECTNTCNPDVWDGADAPRALGMCQANYYAQRINHTLPGLQEYCRVWGERYMDNPSSAPYQYSADGTNSASYQSGYFAQGLQALFQSGGHDPSLFAPTLDSALSHYSTTTRTWDWTACFGVYTQAFAVRALGFGIGRDEASFPLLASFAPETPAPSPQVNLTNSTNQTNQTGGAGNATGNITSPPDVPAPTPSPNTTNSTTAPTNQTNTTQQNATDDVEVPREISFSTISPALPVTIAEPANQTFTFALSNPDDIPYAAHWLLRGVNQTVAFNQSTYRFLGNHSSAGSWNVTLLVTSSRNNLTHTFSLSVTDTPLPAVNTTPNVSQNITQNATLNVTQNATQNTTVNATQNVTVNVTNATNSTNATTNITTSSNAPTNLSANLSNATAPEVTVPVDVVQNETIEPTPSRGGGGGGGGGGGAAPREDRDAKKETSGAASPAAKDERLKSAIDQYFAGDLPADVLVKELRKYYGAS